MWPCALGCKAAMLRTGLSDEKEAGWGEWPRKITQGSVL